MYFLTYLVFVRLFSCLLMSLCYYLWMSLFWYLSRYSVVSFSEHSEAYVSPCRAIFSACETALSEMSCVIRVNLWKAAV